MHRLIEAVLGAAEHGRRGVDRVVFDSSLPARACCLMVIVKRLIASWHRCRRADLQLLQSLERLDTLNRALL